MESKPKVILFGTGSYFADCLPFARQYFEIIAVAESDPKVACIDDFRLLSIVQLEAENFDYIVIMSGFVEEITSRLLDSGISASKIKTVDHFPEFIEQTTRLVLAQCFNSITHNRQSSVDTGQKRVRFVINSLGGGGAEKALINLLNQLDSQHFHIDLLVLFSGDTYRSAVPSTVRVTYLNDTIRNTTCLKTALKFASDEQLTQVFGEFIYDVDIAFLEGWSTRIVGACRSGYKLAWCHTNLSTNHWTEAYWHHSVNTEQRCYEHFNLVIFVSNDSQSGFQDLFPRYPSQKLMVVPNLIATPVQKAATLPTPSTNCFHFIAVGRLVPIKGFERLIRAFNTLSEDIERIKLVIVGEGSERQNLEQTVAELGLGSSVLLPGFSSEPFAVKNADCFVSSSHTEGHPLAIAEALLSGLPVVATACGGCAEILENGRSGLLVENSEAGLYSGMKRVVESATLRNDLIKAAQNSNIRASNSEALNKIQSLINRAVINDQ